MYPYQFGFSKKTHHTINCAKFIRKIIDDKKTVCAASLDLSMAFFSIDHEVVVNNLQNIGLLNNSTALLAKFLSKRTQRIVVINFFGIHYY